MTTIVNGQKAKHGEKIEIRALNVRSPQFAKDAEEAKFVGGHGIIARDKGGEFLAKVDGHSYGEDKVKEIIELVLKEG